MAKLSTQPYAGQQNFSWRKEALDRAAERKALTTDRTAFLEYQRDCTAILQSLCCDSEAAVFSSWTMQKANLASDHVCLQRHPSVFSHAMSQPTLQGESRSRPQNQRPVLGSKGEKLSGYFSFFLLLGKTTEQSNKAQRKHQ